MTAAPGVPSPIRVAMVIQSYPPVLGGAQRQLQRLGPLLERRGIESTVITRRPPGAPRREREPGLDVRRLPVPRSAAGASLAYVAGGTLATLRLRPDVVHVYDLLSPGTIGLLAATLLRAPVVAKVLSTGPGGDIDRLRHKPLGARRLGLIARRFAAFNTLAAEVEEELAGGGVTAERMHRIPNGVDSAHYRPPSDGERAAARARLSIDAETVVAVYCGRLAPVKRLDLLLEAFAGVPGELVIAGEGSERARLRELASSVALAGRVHVLDTVTDPLELYRAADLYVSASLTEGMSGSVLEALACGLPVAASPASGMSALLRPDTGRVAADTGAAALAGAITELAGDAALRARLGAAGRELVQRDYSLESTADRLAALYRTLLGREVIGAAA